MKTWATISHVVSIVSVCIGVACLVYDRDGEEVKWATFFVVLAIWLRGV